MESGKVSARNLMAATIILLFVGVLGWMGLKKPGMPKQAPPAVTEEFRLSPNRLPSARPVRHKAPRFQ